MRTSGQTKSELTRVMRVSDSKNRPAAIKNSGPVIAQWNDRFLNQLTPQPIAIAKRIVVADNACRGRQ
jgi:hypothetical protein